MSSKVIGAKLDIILHDTELKRILSLVELFYIVVMEPSLSSREVTPRGLAELLHEDTGFQIHCFCQRNR